MAAARKYRVRLYPAKLFDAEERGNFAVAITYFDGPTTTIEAESLTDLNAKLAGFANLFPEIPDQFADEPRAGRLAWAVGVDIADGGRKPAGFAKMFNGVDALFVPEAAAV